MSREIFINEGINPDLFKKPRGPEWADYCKKEGRFIESLISEENNPLDTIKANHQYSLDDLVPIFSWPKQNGLGYFMRKHNGYEFAGVKFIEISPGLYTFTTGEQKGRTAAHKGLRVAS